MKNFLPFEKGQPKRRRKLFCIYIYIYLYTYCKIDSFNRTNCKAFIAHIASAAQYLMAIHCVFARRYEVCFSRLECLSTRVSRIQIELFFICFAVDFSMADSVCFVSLVVFLFFLFYFSFWAKMLTLFLHIDAHTRHNIYEHTCPCSNTRCYRI